MKKLEKVAAGWEQKLDRRRGETNTRVPSQIARAKGFRPRISPLSEDWRHRLHSDHHCWPQNCSSLMAASGTLMPSIDCVTTLRPKPLITALDRTSTVALSERDLRAVPGRSLRAPFLITSMRSRLATCSCAMCAPCREKQLAPTGLEPLFPRLGDSDRPTRARHDRRRTSPDWHVWTPRNGWLHLPAANSMRHCFATCLTQWTRAGQRGEFHTCSTTGPCSIPLCNRKRAKS
jgi:hypothetical protein